MKVYSEKIATYEAQEKVLAEKLKGLSLARTLLFLTLVIGTVLLANIAQMAILTVLVIGGSLGFVQVLRQYSKVAAEQRHISFAREVCEKELLLAASQLNDLPDAARFIERDHAYIADLDIFGKHSLFQLLNRTTTESGAERLAQWLSQPADKGEIQQRQQAVTELAQQTDWRINYQAAGLAFENQKSEYKKLLSWMKKPVSLLPNRARHQSLSLLLSGVTLAAVVFFIINAYNAMWPLYFLPVVIMLVINQQYIKKLRPITEDIVDHTHQNIKTLGGYYSLIEQIEQGHFETSALKTLQGSFHASAASEIRRLKRILDVFQNRFSKSDPLGGNKFYPMINIFLLLDVHWILKIEQWKSENSQHLEPWADAISEFEAYNSLAGFAEVNPDYQFAEVVDTPFHIEFEKLGHPLLSPEVRVCNDFTLTGQGNLAMITGSNMAGKSTFLRTVGTNLVLALMGAPCCAAKARVSHIQVFSSMRTQDNLEEGISSFYAELRRVEQLLSSVEKGEPIFFMLDEMFKGTNSKDRHKGGFSLIKQLSELNAFGIISTHDLELATLAGKHSFVTNFSFNSEISEGNMSFNYTLTPGLCTDFNASELMKRSGIRILEDVE